LKTGHMAKSDEDDEIDESSQVLLENKIREA
jgi:hypothetical protein